MASIPENFSQTIHDFIVDIETTFPELSSKLEKWKFLTPETQEEILKDLLKNQEAVDKILNASHVMTSSDSDIEEELRQIEEENQIEEIEKTIEKTIEELDNYRLKEGKETEKDLIQKISIINSLLADIENVEKTRLDNKKAKLLNEFNKLNIEIDQNRLEQEMIYYIEKFDINEELIRLKSHIKLFMEALGSK